MEKTDKIENNQIEKFETNDIVDSCHFVCQNLNVINLLMILILIVLGYMYLS